MTAIGKKQKELTGWHVLFLLLGFFGIMLVVNIYFTVMAVKTFSGEDVPRSYRQGLDYNQTIEMRTQQANLGWTAAANSEGDRILVSISDPSGTPISGLTFTAKLRHPATLSNDRLLDFTETKPGIYEAKILGLKGKWLLMAATSNQEDIFRFEHELWLV